MMLIESHWMSSKHRVIKDILLREKIADQSVRHDSHAVYTLMYDGKLHKAPIGDGVKVRRVRRSGDVNLC